MELSKIQYLGEKERYLLIKLQENECSIREIARKHKDWLPENLYRAVNKLKALELVYQDDKKLSLSHEGTEILTYLSLVGEI